MASSFCPECGTKSEGAVFCPNCGTNLGNQGQSSPQSSSATDPYRGEPQPQYQQPPQSYSPSHQQGGPYGRFGKPNDYIRPANYQFTTTITERISGTLKLDVHVVEEIEDREDLQQEAMKLLLINFTIIAIFRSLSVLIFSNFYTVFSPVGSVVEIFLETFVVGYVYIVLLAEVGKNIGGSETSTSRDEMIRVLAYAYTAAAIEQILYVVSDIYAGFTDLLWLGALIYQFIVILFCIRRALDKGYGTAIITVIIAYIGKLIAVFILYQITASIFGATYY